MTVQQVHRQPMMIYSSYIITATRKATLLSHRLRLCEKNCLRFADTYNRMNQPEQKPDNSIKDYNILILSFAFCTFLLTFCPFLLDHDFSSILKYSSMAQVSPGYVTAKHFCFNHCLDQDQNELRNTLRLFSFLSYTRKKFITTHLRHS